MAALREKLTVLIERCRTVVDEFRRASDAEALAADLAISACALIVHGEIEHALEDALEQLATVAVALWSDHSIVTYPLLAMAWQARKGADERVGVVSEAPHIALQRFRGTVRSNNGVGQKGLEALGVWLGIEFPITVVGQLERFSTMRGGLAHTRERRHVRQDWSFDDLVDLAQRVEAEVIQPLRAWEISLKALESGASATDMPPAGLAV